MTVAELRQKTNLSQQQFAKLFDISVRTLQQWEQGRSTPPAYVVGMMKRLLADDKLTATQINARSASTHNGRFVIPPRNTWRVCIDNPFEQCNRIYPTQQRKVRELVDDLSRDKAVQRITVFGSSVTEQCHRDSDVDLYVEMSNDHNPTSQQHDFPFDLWTNFTVDNRLQSEIAKKGVTVYDKRANTL